MLGSFKHARKPQFCEHVSYTNGVEECRQPPGHDGKHDFEKNKENN